MQENEFEKQVSQKMDEFRLRPSEPVWLQIDKELRHRRRRRLLFIPLLATLLVGGFFTWQAIFPESNLPGKPIVVSSSKQSTTNNLTHPAKAATNSSTGNGKMHLLKIRLFRKPRTNSPEIMN